MTMTLRLKRVTSKVKNPAPGIRVLECAEAAVFADRVVHTERSTIMGLVDIHATFVVDHMDLWVWLVVLKTLTAVRRDENGSGKK